MRSVIASIKVPGGYGYVLVDEWEHEDKYGPLPGPFTIREDGIDGAEIARTENYELMMATWQGIVVGGFR